jgi:hypothetical protein
MTAIVPAGNIASLILANTAPTVKISTVGSGG